MGKNEPRVARHQRHKRVRAKVEGTTSGTVIGIRPTLDIFITPRFTYHT